jgi:dienelactone hydrolase
VQIKVGMLVLSVLFLGGCNAASSGLSINTVSASGASEQIPATLLKPDGPGPFPAVIIMHDCSGLGPRSSGAPRRWARELLTQGYVVLIPIALQRAGTPRAYALIRLPPGEK